MQFDQLPADARVRIPDALAVTGFSRSTFYSLAKAGRVPPVVKLAGGRSSGVIVGELRKYLTDSEGYRAPSPTGAA
ncbi:helix-turn-helix transcriptional regulator [Panacagrimonas sp.]|uniref:helix-turn-helix transcriptional regulator n=1 Tax=Panacagrimonas sp. TaxID=2480088 RepID=UPI003B52EF9E